MNRPTASRNTLLASLVLPIALAVSLSGCTLLGLGAAAGAVVGGCSLLDDNADDQITQSELASGIFTSWDTNEDSTLTEAEFEAGVDRSDLYADWSGDFGTWDADDDDIITASEFEAGVGADPNTANWADDRCDDLGL